jgi:hypothetical protein
LQCGKVYSQASPPIDTSSSPQEAKPIEVDWYNPQMQVSEKPEQMHMVLTGKTEAGYTISFSSEEIPIILEDGQVKNIPVPEAALPVSMVTDGRGMFELHLHLPISSAQLPIQVASPDGNIRRFQLTLRITQNDVVLASEKAKQSPYARRKWGVWGGLGYNYLKYEQSSADIPSALTLESFDMPTLYGKIVRSLNKEFAFQATANTAPGKTASSDSVQVSQGQYNWTFLTGEFTFFHPKWKLKYKKYFSEFGAQWGLQYHLVPFMARSSTTDASETSVVENELIMAAIGMTWLIHYDRYFLLETFLRYQTPMATGDVFDIRYKMAFDGSVGLIYKINTDWRAGVFWYGQMHQYAFTNHRDVYFDGNGGGGPYISGDQKIFFTNIEARIGWEFD